MIDQNGSVSTQNVELWQVVYVSSATRLFTRAELETLLDTARARNTAEGLTGMLAYHDGNFIQALEGSRAQVEELTARIARDPRHRGMMTLLHGPIAQRQFGEWSMAFRHLGDEPLSEGHSGLMDDGLQAQSFRGPPDRVHRLLQAFADSQMRRYRPG